MLVVSMQQFLNPACIVSCLIIGNPNFKLIENLADKH